MTKVYHRLETDEEFKVRLDKLGVYSSGMVGLVLDEVAWRERKAQRRIVEDQK